MDTKLVRVDEKVFEELHALAGKLQMREGRRVSINAALRALLLPKNLKSELKIEEKPLEIHSGMNLKKGFFASEKTKKVRKAVKKGGVAVEAPPFEPMKRFSLHHKKFVAE